MNRRGFLRVAGAVATANCAPRTLFAQSSAQAGVATLTLDESSPLATVPQDFIGLSYESAQLANPAFFAAENIALIALFRGLSDEGVLRLGGGTSDFTAFAAVDSSDPAPFDAVGPDTSKNVKSNTPITPKSLRNLRAFLDATNWRCLYGLNLGRGTPERAAEEAVSAQNILGPRLIAFQLGNEPDAWRNRYRPATWTYSDYWKEWIAAHAAIVTRVPNARFAGPDVATKIAYVTEFAEDVKKSVHDVVLLTSHYYAMGPSGAPDMTIDRLLSRDPKLDRDLKTAVDAARSAGLPYRMTEGNSCWNGGQPGVSDTFASALWAAGMMLEFASLGCSGVNLHGGGNGFYTPIAGSIASRFVRRPEYIGMEIVKPLIGATLIRTTLKGANDRVRVYAARKAGATLVLVINAAEKPAGIRLPIRRPRRQWVLAAPAIDAKEGIELTESRDNALHDGILHVAVYSAILIET